MDFTLNKYKTLLNAFVEAGYHFVTFRYYCEHCNEMDSFNFVIVRHDVDKRVANALDIAKIDAVIGNKSSFYFRFIGRGDQSEIIQTIASLGHEIGYHYEDLSLCNGDVVIAIKHFEDSLFWFRQFYPVKTVCMHGSPRSKFDSRDLWKQYDYHDYGIIGEPYFDVDFSKVFYLTDTGRRWDGFNVSVRDKVPSLQDEWAKKGWVYHSTDDILKALSEGSFPEKLMLTTHPQRWTNHLGLWIGEYLSQSTKNVVKGLLVR